MCVDGRVGGEAKGFCTSFVPRLFETSCVVSSAARDVDSIAALALDALKDILLAGPSLHATSLRRLKSF